MKHGALACVFLCNPWETEGTLFTRCFSGNGPASSGTVFRASCRNSIACAFLEPGVRGRRYYFLFFRAPLSFERLEYSAARCLRGTLSSRRRRRRRSRCRRAPTAASQGTERASAPSLRGSASCAELSDTMTRCGVSVCVGCRAASCGWA